ncbi:MAG: class I SAM-dependent methyltransferase [Pseudomonadota bacterium]
MPYPDRSFDVVTISLGIRNFADRVRAGPCHLRRPSRGGHPIRHCPGALFLLPAWHPPALEA